MTPQKLFEFGERAFIPQETLEQIAHFGKFDFIKWNISKAIFCIPDDEADEDDEVQYCKGIVLKINHPNYDDMVIITLSYDDTYRIRFADEKFNVSDDIEGIYFDMLFECINERIVNKKAKFDFNLN